MPQSSAPYGILQRAVRYANTPSNTFPPTGLTWTTVARNLSDFSLEYQDGSGTVLTGNPLSATNRGLVSRIVLFMEGFDQVGPDGHPQQIQMRSEILLRN